MMNIKRHQKFSKKKIICRFKKTTSLHLFNTFLYSYFELLNSTYNRSLQFTIVHDFESIGPYNLQSSKLCTVLRMPVD